MHKVAILTHAQQGSVMFAVVPSLHWPDCSHCQPVKVVHIIPFAYNKIKALTDTRLCIDQQGTSCAQTCVACCPYSSRTGIATAHHAIWRWPDATLYQDCQLWQLQLCHGAESPAGIKLMAGCVQQLRQAAQLQPPPSQQHRCPCSTCQSLQACLADPEQKLGHGLLTLGQAQHAIQ